jgi:hypothetical protein
LLVGARGKMGLILDINPYWERLDKKALNW